MCLNKKSAAVPLNKLALGMSGIITGINDVPLAPQLVSIGFIPGETVKSDFTSPSGDPTAYVLGGCAKVALREAEAENIFVKVI